MRRRATKQQIAVTVGLMIILAAAGYWWSPHIWWAYMISRSGAKVPSIPVSTLQAPGKTQGWFTCRIGPLSFKLPPEFAEEADRSVVKQNKSMVSLKTPSLELGISVPFQVPEGAPTPVVVQIATMFKRSPIELIADGFRASTDDFRWTMSHDELQRHQILLNLGYHHAAGTKVETLFGDPLEGLLIIHDKTQASFQWQSGVKSSGGVLVFSSTGGGLDLDQLRDICASVTIDDAKLEPPSAQGDASAFVDAIEMTKDE